MPWNQFPGVPLRQVTPFFELQESLCQVGTVEIGGVPVSHEIHEDDKSRFLSSVGCY